MPARKTRVGNVAAALVKPNVAAALAKPTVAKPATKPTKSKVATKTAGRPPRDEYKRLHFSISEKLAMYLDEAWRTNRRPDGKFYRTASAYVEDLLAADREARAKSKRTAS